MNPPLDTEDLNVALDQAAEWLRRARRVAVLTGAGVSAESGLATFRGAGGLWEGHSIEDVATPSAFQRNPALVWRFYKGVWIPARAGAVQRALKEVSDEQLKVTPVYQALLGAVGRSPGPLQQLHRK